MENAPPVPPPLSPYLTVANASAAIEFYERAFGAKLVARHDTPDGKKIMHAALALSNGGTFMLCDDFPEMSGGKARDPNTLGNSPVTLHLDLPDVDTVWKLAVDAGAQVTMPLADMFWGDRYGQLVDPFGHRWSLATRKKQASEPELRAGAEKHFPAKS